MWANFFLFATEKMLSRKLSLYSNIDKSNRLLTITDSHFLGSYKGPGMSPKQISASSQLSHSRWVPGPRSICSSLKDATHIYQPFFFLFTSQYSIFSYLNYHKKGWLLPKEKNHNDPERPYKSKFNTTYWTSHKEKSYWGKNLQIG